MYYYLLKEVFHSSNSSVLSELTFLIAYFDLGVFILLYMQEWGSNPGPLSSSRDCRRSVLGFGFIKFSLVSLNNICFVVNNLAICLHISCVKLLHSAVIYENMYVCSVPKTYIWPTFYRLHNSTGSSKKVYVIFLK